MWHQCLTSALIEECRTLIKLRVDVIRRHSIFAIYGQSRRPDSRRRFFLERLVATDQEAPSERLAGGVSLLFHRWPVGNYQAHGIHRSAVLIFVLLEAIAQLLAHAVFALALGVSASNVTSASNSLIGTTLSTSNRS